MSDDWSTRSAGAQRAVRLDQAGDVATYQWSSGSSQCSYDSTLQAFKISVDDSITESSAAAVIKFAGSYGNGSTHWVSFRVRVDPVMAYYRFPDSSGRPRYKLAILSRADADGASNTLGSNPADGETVIQMTYGNNLPTAYYYAPGITLVDAAFTSVNGATVRMQPSIDNGANPLTGNNPSTGSAWTSAQQERARYGGVQDAETFDSEFVYGLGDAITGGLRLVPDTWVTITVRIDIGTFGSANSRFRGWAAPEGQPYRQLWDKRNITLGDGSAPNHSGIWLTPFLTNGQSGGCSITAHDSNITGVTYHVCGPGTPSGVGQLSYSASTGRFQWRGAAGTYGTAVGYASSIATGKSKLTLAVKDNAGGIEGSYVVITVNAAALPGTDQVDNVTISTAGRPTGAIYYKDFIESLEPILAPGGYYPYPAWMEGMTLGQWRQLPGTNISAVNPSPAPSPNGTEGPQGKIDDWTGWATHRDTSKIYSVAQGGHAAYSGNETDMLDLERDVPAWVQLRAPYLTPPSGGSVAYYAANEPSSRHGYGGNFVQRSENKIYNFGGSTWDNGSQSTDIFSYDIAANTYSAQGGNGSLGSMVALDLTFCQDTRNDDVYMFGGTGNGNLLGKWDASTKVVTSGSDINSYRASAAVDTTRNRILIIGGDFSCHHVYNIATGVVSAVTLTGSQATTVQGSAQQALMYVAALDLFLLRTAEAGGNVYQINPATWACELYTTTGGSGIPAFTPSNGANQLYNKGVYLPELGGMYMTRNFSADGWFLKLQSLDQVAADTSTVTRMGGMVTLSRSRR